MGFNEEQNKKIYEFIMKYNSDDEYKKYIEELYNTNSYKLSMLEIYAIEEILRYGVKNIYNKFLNVIGNDSIDRAITLYDAFIKLVSEDEVFKEYKMQQLKENKETLSDMEIFAFNLINDSLDSKERSHEQVKDELEYDPLNPILYSTDNQIRVTLENLFLGEFIYKMMQLPSMKDIKDRQKNGQIANQDKPFIIEKIKYVLSTEEALSQFKSAIDSRYVKVKFDILLGKGESAFDEYIKYNTNISSEEILGVSKDQFDEDLYEYFINKINNKHRK